MTCMCGDPYCGSCGPAQGNFQCHHCGAWGGCDDPGACAEAERLSVEAMYLDQLQSEQAAAEYFAGEPGAPAGGGTE